MTVRRIPVTMMRGGALRAACFVAHDLPSTPRARDALLLRALGAPDATGGGVDGPVAGPDGVQRVLVVSRSQRPDCDVDFLSGTVLPGAGAIDWSGPCGALAAAVGPFAIAARLFPPGGGAARVRLQHVPDGARVDAFVPVIGGEPVEEGVFVEDGVAFPSPEIRLERIEPADQPFPGGAVREVLELPGGAIDATLVRVDEPTVFVRADALGLSGREQPGELDRARRVHERIAAIRELAAARLGTPVDGGRGRGGAPVVCWVARPAPYRGVRGDVAADAIDLLVRCDVGGRLDATPGGRVTAELAVAAAVPGTVVAEVARTLPGVATRIGHASGAVAAGADVSERPAGRGRGGWRVDRLVRSHGARRLLAGELFVPDAG